MNLSKNERVFVLDSMRWSYSSANAFSTCPRMFYLTYLEGHDRLPNAFAEWGSFGHSILEKYYKGELALFDLSSYYADHYKENVETFFPPSRNNVMPTSYYNAGLVYFDTFEDPYYKDEILGVEQKFQKNIGGHDFVGIIDLIVKDKDTGNIFIVDHKSKSKFKSQEELHNYLRQLYLYSLYINETYEIDPSKLIFNMFRAQTTEEIPFDKIEQTAAVDWFNKTVDSVYREEDFPANPSDYFCNYICSVRNQCEHSIYYEEGGDEKRLSKKTSSQKPKKN